MPPKSNFELTGITLTISPLIPEIKDVIFNNPATIVIWKDKSKTVVKIKPGEKYDRWTGLAMCICKKYYGEKFHKTFRKWCEK